MLGCCVKKKTARDVFFFSVAFRSHNKAIDVRVRAGEHGPDGAEALA